MKSAENKGNESRLMFGKRGSKITSDKEIGTDITEEIGRI